MTTQPAMTDTVLWLGEKRAPALRELIAAQFPLHDEAPQNARFGIVAEAEAAASAVALALERPDAVTGLVLLGPNLIDADGRGADEALIGRIGALKVPLLTIFGTKDRSAPPECGRHYRARLASCNVVFLYDAGAGMAAERPEALAELVIDFLRRGDTFIVRQTSDRLYR